MLEVLEALEEVLEVLEGLEDLQALQLEVEVLEVALEVEVLEALARPSPQEQLGLQLGLQLDDPEVRSRGL